MSLLGDRLKELRGETSQAEMARTLGMPRPQWIRYETGKSVPGSDILAEICQVHAVSADWLLGIEAHRYKGTSQTPPPPPGELPTCSKCPIKKKLAKLEALLAK